MSVDLAHMPILPPPPGVESNFVNPDSRATLVVYFAVIVPTIALLMVIARVYTQVTISRRMHIDDYLSASAIVFSIAFSTLAITRIPHGFGRHMWDVPVTDFEPIMQYVMAMACMALMMVVTAKLSILFFYRRIFGAEPIFNRVVTGFIIFVFLYCLAYLFVMIFNCVPVKKNWSPATPGHCGNPQAVVLTSAVFNLFTDLIILLLPLPIIWRLRLAPRLKMGLFFIFAIGGGTVVLSAVRLWAMNKFGTSPDLSWNIITLDITSIFEFNSLIICGCLPILKPLLQHWFPTLLPQALFGKSTVSQCSPLKSRRSVAPSTRFSKRWVRPANTLDMELGFPTDKTGTSSPERCSSDAEGLATEERQQSTILKTVDYAVEYPAHAHQQRE